MVNIDHEISPQPTNPKSKEWTSFLKKVNYPLSDALTREIKELRETDPLSGNIVELACGLHPSSDAFIKGKGHRLLIDFADISEEFAGEPDTTFVQADLTEFESFHNPDHPYMKALQGMGGKFNFMVIGSGLNYFDWKSALPILLQDMNKGGRVFIYTGIFAERRESVVDNLVDHEHKPQSPEEIALFFQNLGYEIVKKKSRDAWGQIETLIIAKKPV